MKSILLLIIAMDLSDHTIKFGSEGVDSLNLISCRLLIIFSNWFPTCMDSLEIFLQVIILI